LQPSDRIRIISAVVVEIEIVIVKPFITLICFVIIISPINCWNLKRIFSGLRFVLQMGLKRASFRSWLLFHNYRIYSRISRTAHEALKWSKKNEKCINIMGKTVYPRISQIRKNIAKICPKFLDLYASIKNIRI